MNKILFYTCRNVTGKFSKGLVCNFKILEKENKTIDFLMSTKTQKCKKYIESVANITINSAINLFGDYYLSDAVQMKSWKEVYDALDVSELKNYDSFYIMGGIHFPQSNLNRFSKRTRHFPNDRGQLKFIQNGKHIINVFALHKAHVLYDIPLHEFAYDSDEMSSNLFQVEQNLDNYHLYHIYDLPIYDMRRLDSLQYFLQEENQLYESNEKIYDFTFGYTVFSYGNRVHYSKDVYEIASKFGKVNLYTKNNVTNTDTSIDRDSYLYKLSQSKYTMILPAYDEKCFSLYRFIEALHNDCLPIIHRNCFTDDIDKSYNVDMSLLKTIYPFSESKRLELLEYFKNKFLVFEKGFIS